MRVGRWSESGGDRVPAVMVVSESVVSTTSMRVAVLWWGSYLVGVVIVVWRLFSMRKVRRVCVGARRLMLMSPCIVIDVVGWAV